MGDAGSHDVPMIRGPLAVEGEEHRAPAAEPLPLEPVEGVTITTLVDNVVDVLLPDTGPARRPKRDQAKVEVTTMEEGAAWSAPVAEHGFSALVDVELATGRAGGSPTRSSSTTRPSSSTSAGGGWWS